MVKLTESKVLSNARASSLKNVKNLNCWGSDIDDISILRKMPNLEVLNLSVNSVSTLKDMKYCPKLREIYLRKNCISDINELIYLKHLPQLKVLWLSENPCTDVKFYRSTIIRNLPNLVKFDNKEVDENERRIAECEGLDLEACPSDVPDFTGLDLSVTLQEDDLERFLKTGRYSQPKLLDSSRQDVDIQTINKKRTQLGLKPLDLQYTTKKSQRIENQSLSHTRTTRSNACAATMLLLNELDAEELRSVIEAAEGLLQTFEVIDERESICD